MSTTSTDRLAGLSTSVAVKAPCKAVATTLITLSGEQTVGGVACAEGDRVLLAVTGGSISNGIWVCDAGAWSRAKDFDGARDVVTGTMVLVKPGTAAEQFWLVKTTGAIFIGTTSIEIEQHTPEELALRGDLADSTDVAMGDDLYAINTTVTGSVATTGHDWHEAQTLNSKANFSIPADGTTQTTALVTLMTTLAAYRGVLQIAHGTVFDEMALIAAVPTGMQVRFRTTWADGSYKQKFDFVVNGGDVDDDAAQIVADKYHSITMGLNTGANTENKSDSGARRYVSDYQAIAKTTDFNGMVYGLSRQRGKHPTKNVWQETIYVHSPLVVGMGETHGKWVALQAAVAGERCRNSVGYIYQATTTTTNGSTEPVGTGASISDGGTTWRFVQYTSVPTLRIASTYYGLGARFLADSYKVYVVTTAGTTASGAGPTGTGTGITDGTLVCDYEYPSLDIQRSVVVFEEDGTFSAYSPAGTAQRSTFYSGAQSHYFEIDDATGDVVWRDDTRGVDIIRVSTARGAQFGIAEGRNWVAVTGTGPNAPVTGAGKVANGGATNMSTIVPPVGRTQMTLVLRFDDANTTVIHGTGTNATRLKGAINVNPAAGSYMTLEYDSTDTASWRELSRSF